MEEKKEVFVVGGGFAGIYTCLYLLQSDIKDSITINLISKHNYFLFTPLLHEVATGGLNKNLITTPIREILKAKNIRIHIDEITNIDLTKNSITSTTNSYNYDYLVLATGSKTNYYNVSGAKENSIGLKELKDGEKVKNKILDLFECKEKFTIAIVGGGPTGIELAVEIKQYVDELEKIYNKQIKNVSINLITQDDALVKRYPKKIQKQTLNFVRGLGISVFLNSEVKKVGENTITYNDKRIESDLILWAAGVVPNIPNISSDVVKGDTGCLICDKYLRLHNYQNVYAGGDIVDGYPMLAQTATKHAKVIAQNIANHIQNKALVKENVKIVGTLLSLGQKNAVGQIFNFSLYGMWVWFLWRTVYLFKTPMFSKKVRIAVNWTLSLFTHRDSSRY